MEVSSGTVAFFKECTDGPPDIQGDLYYSPDSRRDACRFVFCFCTSTLLFVTAGALSGLWNSVFVLYLVMAVLYTGVVICLDCRRRSKRVLAAEETWQSV
jgi:hypothetical protein